MSNLIPPLLSSSPPPIVGPLDEEDDDEFGDFRAAAGSFDCDDFSLPPSPQKSPEKELKTELSKVNLDINSNKSQKITEMPSQNVQNGEIVAEEVNKDFQDRRKSFELNCEITVNCSNSQLSVNDQVLPLNNEIEGTEFNSKSDDLFNLPLNQPEIENQSELNSFSNEEKLFSESLQEKTNSDDLSELNETNEECSEEINFGSTSKEEKNSQKDTDDEFGDFEHHFGSNELQKASDDEFDDFVKPASPCSPQEDDDFGNFESPDFGEFLQSEKPVLLEIDLKNAIEKSEVIFKEIFPPVNEDGENFENTIEIKDSIFDELKDVTETNALIYQWSKSNSQKMFLRALNIDTRNILYGPSWNGSMPRFAGLTPLEPVKTEILTPTPVQNLPSPSNNSSQKSNSDIPTAQFDWSGSGLINPLDSTSIEPPGPAPEAPHLQNEPDFLPPAPPSEKPELDLFDLENLARPEQSTEQPKAADFSPFPSPKLIPLRETHISTESTLDFNSKPGWLQPTILTPDLSRKEPVVEDVVEDDEFDDFQMVLPEKKLSEFDIKVSQDKREHIQSGPKEEEEEFTEFHAPPLPMKIEMLRPVPAEPLKPSVQYSAPTQINWPEPGVTDEDIKNIELAYSRKSEPKAQNSLDDEEWTDFVSVTNPLKVERTATPDLPLSVLNLNSVHASKHPIPVITPTGLVQTKLSSNPTSVVQTSVTPTMFRPPPTQFHPSLISAQFAASGGDEDDEDWSDFVSSQPTQPNGLQQKTKAPPINWTTATTNIIMNPSHFESLGGLKKVSALPTRSVSSISALPELDFIAPKNRTSKK